VHAVQAKTTRTIGGVSFSGMRQILSKDPRHVADSTPAQLIRQSPALSWLPDDKSRINRRMNIKLNKRVSLRPIQTGLAWLFSRADWTNPIWTGVLRD
jgi:hypothetical protein